MLLLKLAFATTHLVIVIDVAALTLALSIDSALAGMGTVCGHGAPTVLMIAVVAHAHRVER